MSDKGHLPLFGAGPAYVVTISIATLAALALHYLEVLPLIPLPGAVTVLLRISAVLLIVLGVRIWILAVFKSRLQQNIKDNRLITDGVYGWVRHPVYSAFTLAEWGLLLWTADIWFFLLIPIYWTVFSLIVRQTEEKWLLQRYGQEYTDYCRRVNRCIPWFPKKINGK